MWVAGSRTRRCRLRHFVAWGHSVGGDMDRGPRRGWVRQRVGNRSFCQNLWAQPLCPLPFVSHPTIPNSPKPGAAPGSSAPSSGRWMLFKVPLFLPKGASCEIKAGRSPFSAGLRLSPTDQPIENMPLRSGDIDLMP